MKRIINLVFALVVTTLFIISCAEPNDSNNNTKTEEQLYLRINFTGTDEPIGAWIWGDFDASEISKCTTWSGEAFPLTGKNGDFFVFDIKLNKNPVAVNFIILGDGWSKLSGDGDITFKFPKKYREIWIDTKGKIWVDAEQTKEPSGLISASITGRSVGTLVGRGCGLPWNEWPLSSAVVLPPF